LVLFRSPFLLAMTTLDAPLTETELQLEPVPPPQQMPPARLVSLDAYRGLAMILMASQGLAIPAVARNFPTSSVWQKLSFHTEHVHWMGCSLWDLIQPSFSFMVGVALPFSLASRRGKGQTFAWMLFHALVRSFILVMLGVLLRSLGQYLANPPRSFWKLNFTFEDTLSQIGLGYTFLFLLAWTRPRTQLIAAFAILLAYWVAFVAYPKPADDFDFQKQANLDPKTFGMKSISEFKHPQGFGRHWDFNTNLAAAFDRKFLNWFPRQDGALFMNNKGGYLTLSFIPTLATMILGLLAGGLLRSHASTFKKLLILNIAGLVGLGLGLLLDHLNICPIVKRIWTPSWTLFSGGWAFLILGFFFLTVDITKQRWWVFPMVVVGMNSIAMYVLADGKYFAPLVRDILHVCLGKDLFTGLYAPIYEKGAILLIFWLVLLWMYRKKVFIRI